MQRFCRQYMTGVNTARSSFIALQSHTDEEDQELKQYILKTGTAGVASHQRATTDVGHAIELIRHATNKSQH